MSNRHLGFPIGRWRQRPSAPANASPFGETIRPAGRHIAEAHVLKRGRQINFLEATLATDGGKLIATATATIMIAAMKKRP